MVMSSAPTIKPAPGQSRRFDPSLTSVVTTAPHPRGVVGVALAELANPTRAMATAATSVVASVLIAPPLAAPSIDAANPRLGFGAWLQHGASPRLRGGLALNFSRSQ